MYMDRVLKDDRLIRVVKFYAGRKDWHGLFQNLQNKDVLFANDSVASIKAQVKAHPEFVTTIIVGHLDDLKLNLSNPARTYNKADMLELRDFINQIIR